MAWIKASARTPPEDEQVLIHDNANSRIELGRYVRGKWYVEEASSGRLSEISTVTHWCWLLDSQLNDESEDD